MTCCFATVSLAASLAAQAALQQPPSTSPRCKVQGFGTAASKFCKQQSWSSSRSGGQLALPFSQLGLVPQAAPCFVPVSPWWQPAGQVDTRALIERQGQSWPCRVLRQAEQLLQQAVRGKMALAVLLAALLGLVVIVKWFLFQPRNPSCPPCIGSWIPWVGAAFQFGKAPLEFIEQARSKVRAAAACLPLGVCASCRGEGEEKLVLEVSTWQKRSALSCHAL